MRGTGRDYSIFRGHSPQAWTNRATAFGRVLMRCPSVNTSQPGSYYNKGSRERTVALKPGNGGIGITVEFRDTDGTFRYHVFPHHNIPREACEDQIAERVMQWDETMRVVRQGRDRMEPEKMQKVAINAGSATHDERGEASESRTNSDTLDQHTPEDAAGRIQETTEEVLRVERWSPLALRAYHATEGAILGGHPLTQLTDNRYGRLQGVMTVLRKVAGFSRAQATVAMKSLKEQGILVRERNPAWKPGMKDWWTFKFVADVPPLPPETPRKPAASPSQPEATEEPRVSMPTSSTELIFLSPEDQAKIQAYRKISREIGGVVRNALNALWGVDAALHNLLRQRMEQVKDELEDLCTKEELEEFDKFLQHISARTEHGSRTSLAKAKAKSADEWVPHADLIKDAEKLLEKFRPQR